MPTIPFPSCTCNRFESAESTSLTALHHRISTIPITAKGDKTPALPSWSAYQQRLPTLDELAGWFAIRPETGKRPMRGVALVCGRVSGNLEVIDVDDYSIAPDYLSEIDRLAPGLYKRLVAVKSPRPGLQLLYRCPEIGRNQGLAYHEIESDSSHKDAYERRPGDWVVRRARIETRGEGGYVLAVGSPPCCHKTGRPYEFLNLDYAQLPLISPIERSILFAVAEGFSTIPPAPKSISKPRTRVAGQPLLPGDDFNARGDVRALLERHGWTPVKIARQGELWRRPGKDEGWSATLFDSGILYVHSSSTQLSANTSLTPFALFTQLECGGDFKAATRTLALLGFGQGREGAR